MLNQPARTFPLGTIIVVQWVVILVKVGGQSARVGLVALLLAALEPGASVFVAVAMVSLDPRDGVISWTNGADWLVKVVDIAGPVT